jgi:NAD+ synthase (glutamine-hydrolysing)
VLSLRDYVRKNGFRSVIIALSGGIDSAAVTAIPATRSGRQRRGVSLPSACSSSIRRRRRRHGEAHRTRLSRGADPPMVDAFMDSLP